MLGHRPPRTPLTQPRDSRGLGGDQVEGRQAVRELLAAGRRRTREVWLSADQERAAILTEIEGLAAERRVPVRRVPAAKVASSVAKARANCSGVPETRTRRLARSISATCSP